MTKSELRQHMKSVLGTLPSRDLRSTQILEHKDFLRCFQHASTVSVYLSLPDEFDTSPFIDWCWHTGLKVLVPIFHPETPSATVSFRVFTPNTPLETLPSGVRYPAVGESIPLSEVDVLLVPGMAFTLSGKRIGRGMGFYDRLLESFVGTSVAVCFLEQIREDIPCMAHDQSVEKIFVI